MEWKAQRPWICAKRISKTVTGMICTLCAEIKDLSHSIQFFKERLKIADEWRKGVTANNRKKLHDKMTQHENSKAHELCCQIAGKQIINDTREILGQIQNSLAETERRQN